MSPMRVRMMHEFCAGHRIVGLTGPGAQCRNIHGHNFICWWTFEQRLGWPPPVEFTSIKAQLRKMVDGLLDHAFIVHERDEFLTYLVAHDMKRYPLNDVPTTEAIATEIAKLTKNEFPDLDLLSVELKEGSKNEAIWLAESLQPAL